MAGRHPASLSDRRGRGSCPRQCLRAASERAACSVSGCLRGGRLRRQPRRRRWRAAGSCDRRPRRHSRHHRRAAPLGRSSRVGRARALRRRGDWRVCRPVAARHAVRLVASRRRADDGGDSRRAGRLGRDRTAIPSGGAGADRPARRDGPDVRVAPRYRASRAGAFRGPDRRRERQRQRAGGQGDSPFRPQAGPAVLHPQLRRAPRRSHRGGTVRPRARGVYRRGERARRASSRKRTAGRSFSTKSASCRRARRPSCFA